MASATAVWHQVKEEVMEIHSKLERRTQLDKQVCPPQCSQCVSVRLKVSLHPKYWDQRIFTLISAAQQELSELVKTR